jgi:hypothetical protein
MPTTRTTRVNGQFEIMLEAFAAELIRNGGNGTAALRVVQPHLAAGSSSSLSTRASYLRKHEIVQGRLAEAAARSAAALEAALARYDLTADRVAADMARSAFTELRQVADWGSKVVDVKTGKREYWLRVRDAVEIDPDAHKALVSIERKADGSLKIQLADKLAAQMNLARLKGWIADKPADIGQAVQLIIQR